MPELLELKWMLAPFLACLVLSINHVYLGIHVIERKVIFVDLALAQIAALGATFALTLGYETHGDAFRISLFSLAFTFVGAGAFAIARMRRERVPQEAFIGIIYAAASAAAILILSKSATGGEELKHMLVGDVLLVSNREILYMAIGYGAIGIFHLVFRRQFLAISIDPEAAEASGMRVRLWDLLFYMSFGFVITKSVAIVGVLLVFSYLVVPAVIAQMWAETVKARLLLGWLVAIVASTFGIVWSFYSDYPTGPAVVVMLAIFLVFSGAAYYVSHAPAKLRATGAVFGIALFGIGFFSSLELFRKQAPVTAVTKLSPVDMLLDALEHEEEAHQLDGAIHLGDMHDPRIVPALSSLLSRTKSDQVAEAAVVALTKQRDPRAIPALRHASQTLQDDFLKLAVARAQLSLGDVRGFSTIIALLRDAEAGYARVQAYELLETKSGTKFSYDPTLPSSQNAAPLQRIEAWYQKEAGRLKYDPNTEVFR